jgi:hypothetical protein
MAGEAFDVLPLAPEMGRYPSSCLTFGAKVLTGDANRLVQSEGAGLSFVDASHSTRGPPTSSRLNRDRLVTTIVVKRKHALTAAL